jgi:8-oxo-dGTP diphosphatase
MKKSYTPKTTLLYLYKPKEKKILLAMKKRSFGKGKWNGVGGKLNIGETIKEALIREAQEEIGVLLNQDDLIQVATLNFSFKDNREWDQESHVFFVEKWQNEPIETEEMSPRWHFIDSLPYENMWRDDIHWLPLVLKGEKVSASFRFNKSGEEILDKKISVL